MKNLLIGAFLIQSLVVLIDYQMGAAAGYFNAWALWQETYFRMGVSEAPTLPYSAWQATFKEDAILIVWPVFASLSLLLSFLIQKLYGRFK